MLLTKVRSAPGIVHLIQKCRDNEYMNFDESAAYLRHNSILIDHANTSRPLSRLLHVDQEEHTSITLETAEKCSTQWQKRMDLNLNIKYSIPDLYEKI